MALATADQHSRRGVARSTISDSAAAQERDSYQGELQEEMIMGQNMDEEHQQDPTYTSAGETGEEDNDDEEEEDQVWSGLETPGMLEAKCSLLVPVDSMYEAKLKSLPPGRHTLVLDRAGSADHVVEFSGCTLLQLEPTIVSPDQRLEVMPVTLTVAGKCTFTNDNWRDFSIMMRTKEQSEEMRLPPNGHFEWPDVCSMLLCPLCGHAQPVAGDGTAPGDDDGATAASREYWMLFYPLLQITVLKGSKMTMGFRLICRLTCLDCMEELLDGMRVKVPAQTAAGEVTGGGGGASNNSSSHSKTSSLSWELSAMTILEEAGSASFLQDAPPRPASHPHVDDALDAWTLYNLWEQSGAWEALQADYRMVLSRSMHATTIEHTPSDAARRKRRSSRNNKPKPGQLCDNEEKPCDRKHDMPDPATGEMVELSVVCKECRDAFYCSTECRKEAVPAHECQSSSDRRKKKRSSRKQVKCETCKAIRPYTEMKKCSRCRTATYCCVECQRKDWPRHKVQCPRMAEDRSRRESNKDQQSSSQRPTEARQALADHVDDWDEEES
mmetsp:Transcript_44814/g.66496  ORF Transcript_44814/g.66496 Transcript_44814/m.66496 type:complete len:554 (-) Transcript_44814:221-1882(-)